MDKYNLDFDKGDLRMVFKALYEKEKISESEYKRALVKVSSYRIGKKP